MSNPHPSVPSAKLSFPELLRLPDLAELLVDAGRVTAEMLYDKLGIPLNRADQYFKLLIRMGLLKPDRYSDHAAYLFTRYADRSGSLIPGGGDVVSDGVGTSGTDETLPITTRWIKLKDIHINESIELRLAQDPKVVADYAAAYARGDTLPPLELFDIKGRLMLVAGFHRFQAASRAGLDELRCVIRTRDTREAATNTHTPELPRTHREARPATCQN